jgi:hypothetical protein
MKRRNAKKIKNRKLHGYFFHEFVFFNFSTSGGFEPVGVLNLCVRFIQLQLQIKKIFLVYVFCDRNFCFYTADFLLIDGNPETTRYSTSNSKLPQLMVFFGQKNFK